MRCLISSDWHLTSKPADEYRWGLIPWLAEQADHYKVDAIFILGDLTDAKDRHSAALTNRVVESLTELAYNIHQSANAEVIILMGNHDYIEPGNPFFGFLRNIDNVVYVKERKVLEDVGGEDVLCIPHDRTSVPAIGKREQHIPLVLMHHTFFGAVASNEMVMEGDNQDGLKGFRGRIVSGDIHVPQTLGKVIYCGAPYRIRFNDAFEPRVLLYDEGALTDLHFTCSMRHTLTIDSPEQLATSVIAPGDQVKVRLRLRRAQYSEWPTLVKRIEQEAHRLECELHGVELEVAARPRLRLIEDQNKPAVLAVPPQEVIETFGLRERLDEYRLEIGKRLALGKELLGS